MGVEEIFLQSDYELNEAKAQWICRKNVKSGKELIELAFDCFIASLECTAIDDLYQLAIASGTPITGSQIWASRSTNIGAPEVSVNRLLDSSTGYQTDLISLSPSSTDRFPPRNITMIDVDYPNYSTSSVVTPKSKPPVFISILVFGSVLPLSLQVFMPLAHPHSAPIYYQPMRSAQEIHQRIRSFKTPLVQLHNSASNDLKQMQVRQCRHCQMESRQPLICEFCSQLL